MSKSLGDLTLCQFEFKESRLEPGSFHHFLFYVDGRHQDPAAVRPHLAALLKAFFGQVMQGPYRRWVADLYSGQDLDQAGKIGTVTPFERAHRKEFLLFNFPDPVSGHTLEGGSLDSVADLLGNAGDEGEAYLRFFSERFPFGEDSLQPPWLHPALESYLNHRHQYALAIGVKAHPFHLYIMGDEGFYQLIEPYRIWLRENLRLLDGRP